MIEGCPDQSTMVVYEHNGVFWREPGDITGLEPTALSAGEETPVSIPGDHLIVIAYPNPFNPETTVRAILPDEARVIVDVYDVLGRQIMSIDRGILQAGVHSINIDGSDWSAGVYFVRVQAGAQEKVTKIQLVQ
ncbi:hypothetical protein BMS3Bbin04_01979 [bacterium BMS3Bbin04]|nr:hypothetical protein BMS3Bbin04_01979 [bacterium BMS3Bbin04]